MLAAIQGHGSAERVIDTCLLARTPHMTQVQVAPVVLWGTSTRRSLLCAQGPFVAVVPPRRMVPRNCPGTLPA